MNSKHPHQKTHPIPHNWVRLALTAAMLLAASALLQGQYSWQQPHATVLSTGDLALAQQPFVYTAGATVRYIDFDTGVDTNTGTTTASRWKHHPWDANATGNAASASGVITYVFKRGVVYRGTLTADESGTSGNPIRLTSDPAWGTGEACLYGSERITSGWTLCGAGDVYNINDLTGVYYRDLAFNIEANSYSSTAYTSVVCELAAGVLNRINLARAPNWTETNPDYPQSGWWTIEASGQLRIQQSFPNQTDAADWIGGTVWPGWGEGSGGGANMATYQQGKITAFTAPNAITIDVSSNPYCQYFVENLPQLLDEPNEFYYSPVGAANFPRRLYVRLSGNRNPNTAVIEVGARNRMIRIVDRNNIVISGLTIAVNNQPCPGTAPNPPHWNTNDGNNQAVEISGTCANVTVANCKFRHVIMAVAQRRDDGVAASQYDNIRITDNDIAYVEDQAITLCSKSGGFVKNCQIMRNNLYRIGYRQTCRNYSSIPSITSAQVTSIEIAGNFVDNCWGAGINTYAATTTFTPGTQVRVLVHHNKVVNSLLGLNDYGGIEGWGDGPAHFYNNVSGNARGYRPFSGTNEYNPWGHNIYFDHAYHHTAFNNIVWGTENSLTDPLHRNNSGFMQAVSDTCFFANNSIYKFYRAFCFSSDGSKYVGNLMQDCSLRFHDDGSALSWIAYSHNAYNGSPSSFNAGTQATFAAFQSYLSSGNAQSSQVGVQSGSTLMADPANHDFRPAGSAVGNGARVFVPWNLAQTKGEWHFYAHPAGYTTIASTDVPTGGTGNTLTCASATAGSFVLGNLEDWINGALHFNGSSTTATAATSANLDMTTNNFIIEAYVRTSTTDRAIVNKGTTTGYQLQVATTGKARMRLLYSGTEYWKDSSATVTDGNWHHILVEVDRGNSLVNIYVDGSLSSGSTSGAFPGTGVSLTNAANFIVGSEAAARYFNGDMDFLRVSKSSFAESATTFAELYEWEFNGPAQCDFTGQKVTGARTAGAIHFVTSVVTITTTTLPAGTVGTAYSQTLAANGGTLPYTWSLASGSLPAGLALNSTSGVISGTPTSAGTSNFTARATDALAVQDTQALSIVINAPTPPTITTTTLPDGTVGAAYNQSLAASGGTLPYTWALASGTLPSGLALNSTSGVVSGTPTSAGTSNFTARVTDALASQDTQALSIIINAPAPIVITTASPLPDGGLGQAYSQTLAATGGVPPYTWIITVGSLPAGLALNSTSGVISGTPTTEQVASFTIQAADTLLATQTKAFSLTITELPTVVESRVAVSGDDAEENLTDGTVNISSSDLELCYDAHLQTTGIRFQNLAIPPDATITDAYIQFTVDENTWTGAVAATIRGQAAANAAIFIAATNNITSRAQTAASAGWSLPDWLTVGDAGVDQRTPSLASIISEITSTANGWASGNSLAIIISGSDTNQRTAVAYNGNAAQAPLLHVEYVVSPPEPPGGYMITVTPAGANLQLSFPTLNGKSYRLMQNAVTPQPGDANWAYAGQQLAGTGATQSFTVPKPASGRVFYTVEYTQ